VLRVSFVASRSAFQRSVRSSSVNKCKYQLERIIFLFFCKYIFVVLIKGVTLSLLCLTAFDSSTRRQQRSSFIVPLSFTHSILSPTRCFFSNPLFLSHPLLSLFNSLSSLSHPLLSLSTPLSSLFLLFIVVVLSLCDPIEREGRGLVPTNDKGKQERQVSKLCDKQIMSQKGVIKYILGL